MIKKRFSQIKTLISEIIAFQKLKNNTSSAEKNLFVNFQNPNLYHRFFYQLLKFYQLSGYHIVYPMSFSKFRNLRNGDQYLSLILKEKNFLSIKKTGNEKNIIEISDNQFSADYFKNYFEENNHEKTLHIPIGFHPLMYHKNLWNVSVDTNKDRINSIFCYGNFDDKAYLDIERTPFKVINRRKLYDYFQTKKDFYLIKNQVDLEKTIENKPNQHFIFAEKYVYPLPMEKVREKLSHFRYFLCCPGVVMPLCHNVIEAMSVGTVPVIQREYAEVMYPNLQNGINAVIFEDLEHLEHILANKIFTVSDEDFDRMRENVLDYYENNLSPAGITKNINQILGVRPVYLNAEHRSIKFLK